ncbi:MAG TPA: hypothetical protein DEP42_07050 [Ruminococcaceae bacterium]|nr:hypothetical protein [Oscillospiraceae bacterium]
MDGSKIEGKKATEEVLIAEGYKKYRGKDIDIYFSRKLCEHACNCIRGDRNVFKVTRRPWVIPDNASVEKDKTIVDTCPSGALKYIQKERK